MGGVVGGVVFLLVVTLLILLVVCLLQKKKQRKYEMVSAAGMQCVACNYVPAHMTSYDIICVRFLCQW